MSTPFEHRIQNQFGGFCVKVLKNEATRIYAENAYRNEKEVSYESLLTHDDESLFINDAIFRNERTFVVLGIPVVVINDFLADAINKLSDKKRAVILLYYFVGQSDRKISKYYSVSHQAIVKTRKAALSELREYLREDNTEC